MTQQEIIEAIKKNIAGQGSMVDISGKLPEILTSIAKGAKFAEKTKVTVQVRAYKWNGDNGAFEDDPGAAGNLIVKGFSETGETLPVQEIPFVIPEDGETGFATVEVEATIGDTIGVVGKIPGKGASCQLVQKVVGPVTMQPEIYPAGIYEIGDGSLSPTIAGDGYFGCAVVTEDFAVALLPHQRDGWDNTYLQWGGLYQRIPFVLKAKDADEAITDFDGALNTAAILSVVNENDCAAKVATIMPEPHYVRLGAFLPSAGILKYLYEHKAEINALITAATQEYKPEADYQIIPSEGVLWSSTDFDDPTAVVAWLVNFANGYAYNEYRNYNYLVFAVSAFRTIY